MHRATRLLALAAALAAIAGCNPGDDAAAIAARVNGRELPASRLEAVAERSHDATGALERAIEQELLVQGALDKKLDKDPRVAEAIDAARRQILAQAYLDRVVAPVAAASRKEIHDFYQRNPALFAQRRIYRFQEVSVEAPPERLEPLRERAAAAKAVSELAAWFKGERIPFKLASAIKPAEQVPLQYLPRLAEMKEGEIVVLPAPRGASILQLVQAQEASLSEAQAAPVIERFLASRRRVQLAERLLAQMRQSASIEYVGEHALAARSSSSISGRSATGLVGKGEPSGPRAAETANR